MSSPRTPTEEIAELQKKRALQDAFRAGQPLPGQTLPNKATIIAALPKNTTEYSHEFWVLAVTRGYQPYVIWTYVVGVEQRASGGYEPCHPYCYSGSYHRDLDTAIGEWNILLETR